VEEQQEARKVEITKRRADWEVGEAAMGSRESSSKTAKKSSTGRSTFGSCSSHSKPQLAVMDDETLKTKTKRQRNDNDSINKTND